MAESKSAALPLGDTPKENSDPLIGPKIIVKYDGSQDFVSSRIFAFLRDFSIVVPWLHTHSP